MDHSSCKQNLKQVEILILVFEIPVRHCVSAGRANGRMANAATSRIILDIVADVLSRVGSRDRVQSGARHGGHSGSDSEPCLPEDHPGLLCQSLKRIWYAPPRDKLPVNLRVRKYLLQFSAQRNEMSARSEHVVK